MSSHQPLTTIVNQPPSPSNTRQQLTSMLFLSAPPGLRPGKANATVRQAEKNLPSVNQNTPKRNPTHHKLDNIYEHATRVAQIGLIGLLVAAAMTLTGLITAGYLIALATLLLST